MNVFGTTAIRRVTPVGHAEFLQTGGVLWVGGMAFAVTSAALRQRAAPSPVVSVSQVVAVVLLLLSVVAIEWGLLCLAAVLVRTRQRMTGALVYTVVVGIALAPLLGLGLYLLIPALAAIAGVGRLGAARVRFPTIAVFIGLVVAGFSLWPSTAGGVHVIVLAFMAGAVEGLAWFWFGRATRDVAVAQQVPSVRATFTTTGIPDRGGPTDGA